MAKPPCAHPEPASAPRRLWQLGRRPFLQSAAGAIAALALPGCRSGGAASTGDGGGAPGPAPVPVRTDRYRTGQGRLFQAIPAEQAPSRLPGGPAWDWRRYGPTHEYVELRTGWPWDNPGGDWLDADLVRQGPTPWFRIQADAASGAAAVASYAVDVTAALRRVQEDGRFCAFLLRTGAPRTIAGTHHASEAPPAIAVTYADGSQGVLACSLTAAMTRSSSMPVSAAPAIVLPAVLEFDPPARPVQSARLTLTVVAHYAGAAPQLDGFLVDPPVSTAPVEAAGIASAHGLLDEGIASDPEVLGAHRYLDGTGLADFVHQDTALNLNTGAERNFDPAIWGRGPSDTSLYPHRGLGKWVGVSPGWSLVSSAHAGEGFAPLVPGLGAMRLQMPAAPGVTEGSVVGYSGTVAANAFLYLPEPDFGLLKRLFVRYYLRLGTPYVTPFAERHQVFQDAAQTALTWTDMGGKTGICPDHTTSYGGVSGTSGGGRGWQMRLSWGDCDAERGGPDENAIALGLHTYDFLTNNAPFPYGATDRPRDTQFGQRGGIGGIVYPGFWYCVELEVDLNTVTAEAPGYLEDGAVRAWLDGRLVFERTGMVMRSLPLLDVPYQSDRLRPCRELGHRGLWFNWFHGGKTVNTLDRTTFVTGLVWARRYIGPMRTG